MNTSNTAAQTPAPDGRSQLDASQRAQIVAILRQFGIAHVALFGSFAWGDAHSTSDIDALARPVQIVTFEDLHPGMREQVQCEQQELL